MHDSEIYVKTEAGREAIRARTLGLSMPVRAILLMVDGQKTVAAMRSLIAGSKAPVDTLDTLVEQGLIESRDGGPPTTPPVAPIVVPTVTAAPPPAPVAIEPPTAIPVPTDPLPSNEHLDFVLPALDEVAAEPSGTLEPVNGGSATDNRYERLYAMMNEIVRDFLPAHRRYFFQLKIERCTTADELLELLHDLRTALGRSRGDAFATDVVARLRSAAV